MSVFSKNLRYLRKRANPIGNWENQKSEPNLTELMKLGEFFNVSVEDLLHKNLDNLQRTALSEKGALMSSSSQDSSPTSSPREADPDAFWLILRELRAIAEKLDALILKIELTANKKYSDKSYH